MKHLPANYVDCEQGSSAWFNHRLGAVTSSRVADAIAKRKKGDEELSCRRRLKFELVSERLTGNASEHYVSRWMEEGKENEPLARAAYEIEMGVEVEQVGYVYHPSLKWAGASPDGLVGPDGLSEYKCPQISTHLAWILGGVIPEEYVPQMRMQLACCEDRQWNDFCSYCPKLPKDLRLFIVRMERNESKITLMNSAIATFNEEVEQMLSDIRSSNKIWLTDGIAEALEKSL